MTKPKHWLQQRPSDEDPAWSGWAHDCLSEFWQQVRSCSFKAADDVTIHYAVYEQPQSQGWVVISPGRIECYAKYQEVMLEMAAAGYSVAAIDHRGQGFSDRISDHPQHGHVDHFDDFVRDFADFMLELKPLINQQPCYLLSHSMGGAIASLYMASYPHPFSAAVLSSPMMGIRTKPWPPAIAGHVIRVGHWLNARFNGNAPRYCIGMKDYTDVPFEANELTHSAARYQWFRQMYLDQPELQLGGPTWQWVMQSLEAMAQLPEAANYIKAPVLVLQASEDRIVRPEPQRVFVDKLQHPLSRLQVVQGSHHEVLMETDAIRHPAMDAALAYFSNN